MVFSVSKLLWQKKGQLPPPIGKSEKDTSDDQFWSGSLIYVAVVCVKGAELVDMRRDKSTD